MDIRTIRTEGLGDSTYVLSTDGVGVVVDPQRDIDRFVSEVEEIGAEVRWVVETHLHNDYVSGARHLAKVLDAELVIPAGAAPVYRHRPAFH
ncbi:MAG: MBL fold metallo-hydrolase, partial [Actinobacteria bacterium]